MLSPERRTGPAALSFPAKPSPWNANSLKSSSKGTKMNTPRGRASPKPSTKHDDGKMELQGTHSPVGSEKSTTSQSISNKERKLALEQDVDQLKKRLRYEEDVHRALERAFSRPLGMLPRLPPFLPAQTIELVAEVAVLEEEVVRLEELVVHFRQDLYKEAVYISSSRRQLGASPSNLRSCPSPPINLDHKLGKPKTTPPRIHMNLDHKLQKPKSTPPKNWHMRSLSEGKGKEDGISSPKPAKKKVHSTREKASETRKLQLEHRVKGHENAAESRNSSASREKIPLDDNPNRISENIEDGISCPGPLKKKVRSRTEKASEIRKLQLKRTGERQENSAESRYSQASGERTPLDDNLNKISEGIGDGISCPSPLKKKGHCTAYKASETRKLQLERRVKCQENAAESRYSPASGERTTLDDNPNRISEDILKCLSSIMMRKSSLKNHRTAEHLPLLSPLLFSNHNERTECRDPYGICSVYGERDIGPYKDLPSIDAGSIKSNRTGNYVFLEERLKVLHRKLAKVKLRNLTHQEKLAFWINIYNSCMMNGYLEYGIPENPHMVVAVMQKATINVGGYLLNPITIEHFILRLPYHSIYNFPKGMKNNEMTARSMFGLELSDPLVTFALSCGSWSSPAVRVYTASQVEDELEVAKRDYLQASVGISPTKFSIPKLLDWYLLDFAKDMDSLLDWICLQLPSHLGKEAVKSLEKAKSKPLSQIVQVLPYDFSFRYLLCT